MRGQSSPQDKPLALISPWFGLGIGMGSIRAPASNLEAGPWFADRLDAGVEVASIVRFSVEHYGQAGTFLEDSRNSASFETTTAGVRIMSHLIVKAGVGTGRYTLDQTQVAKNPTAREFGIELVHGPHAADGGLYVQAYTTHLGPSTAAPNRGQLHGFVLGGAVQIHIVDAIIDSHRP